jgi:hypothetical protein
MAIEISEKSRHTRGIVKGSKAAIEGKDVVCTVDCDFDGEKEAVKFAHYPGKMYDVEPVPGKSRKTIPTTVFKNARYLAGQIIDAFIWPKG